MHRSKSRQDYRKKESLNDLAIFGGNPAFGTKLHVGRPNIGDRSFFLSCIDDILDRYWLTNNGRYVQEFEERVADIIGVKHCIAVSNATVGLEIAIKACGLTNEVIVPSMTFVATAHALRWMERKPIFCDIDYKTHNIDPIKVEELITPNTTGIIGVHLWGRPCDIESLTEISQKHNLKIIYDAAHAFNCSHNGRMIGGFGEAEVFSFHATKYINSLEGGAIVSNNDTLAKRFRLMRNFGFFGNDNVISVGTNGKMNEISAAMGLTSLESLNEFITVNYRNYKLYQQELGGIPGITMITYNENEKNNFQYIVLEINEHETKISRDHIVDILWKEYVLARKYYYPGCHQMEPYKSYYPDAVLKLPETDKLAYRLISLPTGTSITQVEVHQISEIIKFIISNGKTLHQKLTS